MYKIIKDALPINQFMDLNDCLDPYKRGWLLNNAIMTGNLLSWGRNDKDLELPFYNAATTIKYKCSKLLKKDLELIRIHANGQTTGQICGFHEDFKDDKAYSVILFTSSHWNSEWSGEFICLVDGEYKIAPYIPNHAVLIRADWQHNANCPNHLTDKLRTTVAFSYKIKDK